METDKLESENKLCPSSTCHVNAMLIGIVQGDKSVTLLNTPMTINEEFVETAKTYGDPEKRFRFAGKCIKNGCKQWNGQSCGVMNELAADNPDLQIDEKSLPQCGIRTHCRWFSQEGKKACMICPLVITDSSNSNLI